MAGSSELCAVILAAGASSRMGRDKALLPWPPSSKSGTLLSAAIAALKPFAELVLIVTGNNLENLAPFAHGRVVELVRNPDPERGQFSSVQTGLRAALDRGYDSVMLTPVDCPPLCAASLARLRDAFTQGAARGAWAVAPENSGRRGHPLLMNRKLIDAFLSAPAGSNAREVKRTCAEKFEYVSVPDPLLAADLNTPDEYAAAAQSAL